MARNPKGVKGGARFLRRLEAIRKNSENALGAALFKEGSRIMARSKELVPVDTGLLRSTGTVFPPVEKGDKVTVVIAYGTNYGLPVHERLDVFHPTGQAKFLTRAMQEAAPGFSERIAASMRKKASGK